MKHLLAVAALGAVACSSGADDGDDPALAESARYVVHARVFSPEATQGFFIPAASIDAGELDNARALEEPGGGWIYSSEALEGFLIADGEEPRLTRYTLDGEGAFVAGASLSFANEGVGVIRGSNVLVVVDANKAYLLDQAQLQAIAFDPSAMVITGSVSLEGVARLGYSAGFGKAVVRDAGVFFTGDWFDDENWDDVPSGSMLIRIDPATDAVTYSSDERCAGMSRGFTSESGDTYFFSSDYNTMARRGYGDSHGVPDCALRLKAGATTFDPDWQLELRTRTGGYSAIANLPGGGSSIWLRVLDESAVDLPSPADFDTLDAAPGWQWYLLDVESSEPAVRNDERPLSSAGGLTVFVDGRAFTSDESPDYGRSTLLELTPAGFIERASLVGGASNIIAVK